MQKNTNNASKRIANNTLLLYIRMLFIMVVDLYIVRIVLNSLGAVDYGIYDVVAGVVLMLQSVSSVLTISTQRFYSFSLGQEDEESLTSVFTSSLNVYFGLSVLCLVLGETIGLWLINMNLDIPEARKSVANMVFQFSIVSFIFSILQIPFSSAIIANEDMGAFSIISVFQCVLKLLFAISITSVNIDRLAYYGAYLMLISFIIFIIYVVISLKRYRWCKYSFHKGRHLKQIITFSGWTFLGTTASVGINQVCTLLVNVFFGPITNAARAISFQINVAINAFCGSFLTAIRPPMIKAYAEGNYNYLNTLFEFGNKVVFYLLLVICLPLYLEMDSILFYWLKSTDQQAALFSRLIIIYAIIVSIGNPITYIIHAMGRVKEYHVLVEIPTILCAPITYLLYKIGLPAYSTYLVLIIAISCSHIIRLVCLKRFYRQFNISKYFRSFCVPAIVIMITCYLFLNFVQGLIFNDLLRIIIVSICSVTSVSLLLYIFGFDNTERILIRSFMFSFIKK